MEDQVWTVITKKPSSGFDSCWLARAVNGGLTFFLHRDQFYAIIEGEQTKALSDLGLDYEVLSTVRHPEMLPFKFSDSRVSKFGPGSEKAD